MPETLRIQRYSEPYSATGGLAAEGVINQLGRPDIEPLEVLVREAVQNCWDARRADVAGIRVEIGRHVLDDQELRTCAEQVLVSPPPGLPLAGELKPGLEILYFADFGTDGLGGPTRADRPGTRRDFVDFVRNIGQPPDKELGGGSFGYGKAAFYIASRARTILVDTLCPGGDGRPERRFIACGLGDNYDEDGRPHTGRHWWGQLEGGVPEPLTGDAAGAAASALGLPSREGQQGLGTTVVIVAPGVAPAGEPGDHVMRFIADCLVWNFWPRMVDTQGATRRTMEFRVVDRGTQVRLPNPRTHPRLRGFVEAMDRMREEQGADDDFVLDRPVRALRPARGLGRLVIQKGPVAPDDLPDRAVPQGARMTADSVHHVALMRNAELVVKYLPGPATVTGRLGYSGVFRCAVDVDDAFRRSEPPTHDDWVYRALPKGHERSFVKIALERITGVCREAAGYDSAVGATAIGDGLPLGEFADALATLMPGTAGPGARRGPAKTGQPKKRRKAPGRNSAHEDVAGEWIDGGTGTTEAGSMAGEVASDGGRSPSARPPRPPQVRTSSDPEPSISDDGTAVILYPFELRGNGNRVRIRAAIEVMSNDGAQVESEAPLGAAAPWVHVWRDPQGVEHRTQELVVGPDGVDGAWAVGVSLVDELMMRVDVAAEVA